MTTYCNIRNSESPFKECEISGFTVIEAAAGTGKTYNIVHIVIRLLLERNDVTLDNMVIVTFTRAAGSELKTRIKERLTELENNLLAGKPDELAELASKAGTGDSEIISRTRIALLNLDSAMIGTIHSFAMKVLSGYCFESGIKADMTLEENSDAIIEEMCSDYRRSLLYPDREDPKLSKKRIELFNDLPDLKNFVKFTIANPLAKIRFPDDIEDITDLEKSIRQYIAAELPVEDPQKAIWKKAIWKKVMLDAVEYVGKKFRQYCDDNNIITNDGIIITLREILTAPGNDRLLENIRKKFTVGLIDEFQDTNPDQFTIFKQIFMNNPEGTMFVVGDPRQSIYGFRSGDLATYLQAKDELYQKNSNGLFSMNVNRRSGEKFIASLNDIFHNSYAFASPQMTMPEQSAVKGAPCLLDKNGEEMSHPVAVTYDKGKNLSEILEQCADDIAAFIQEGYQIPPTDKEPQRPVRLSDIGVIIRKWDHANTLAGKLQARNIPAVVLRGKNIFLSEEARELAFFLEGMIDNSRQDTLLRALLTPFGDLDINNMHDSSNIEVRVLKLRHFLMLWQKKSFIAMYNAMMEEFQVTARLLQLSGGEKKLAVYTQLADILSEESFFRNLSPGALMQELWRRIDEAKGNPLLTPKLPENDANAVILNTVFGSKGLAYPVVFMPDLFSGDYLCRNKYHDAQNDLIYSPFQSDEEKRLEKDELLQERLRQAYVAFTRARYYCHFYYGKSRSSNSELDWLFKNSKDNSPDLNSPFSFLDTVLKGVSPVFPEESIKTMNQIDGAGESILPVQPTPGAVRHVELIKKFSFPRSMLSFSGLSDWHVPTVFSGENDDEPPENDDPAAENEEFKNLSGELPAELLELHAIPGGNTFGNIVHPIFEECDFAVSSCDELAEIVENKLSHSPMADKDYVKTVCSMVFRTLNVPLPDGRGGSFTLSSTDPARRCAEMDFLYRFPGFRKKAMFQYGAEYFKNKYRITLPGGSDSTEMFEGGFFNGFVDLFFEHKGLYYIVDWKTNKLSDINGNMVRYTPENLAAAMWNSNYYMQYLIYVVAVMKFLYSRFNITDEAEKEKFYRERFGGVRYIFVRGIHSSLPGEGIFADDVDYEVYKKFAEIIG